MDVRIHRQDLIKAMDHAIRADPFLWGVDFTDMGTDQRIYWHAKNRIDSLVNFIDCESGHREDIVK